MQQFNSVLLDCKEKKRLNIELVNRTEMLRNEIIRSY